VVLDTRNALEVLKGGPLGREVRALRVIRVSVLAALVVGSRRVATFPEKARGRGVAQGRPIVRSRVTAGCLVAKSAVCLSREICGGVALPLRPDSSWVSCVAAPLGSLQRVAVGPLQDPWLMLSVDENQGAVVLRK
jgi:hypothetical protein